MKELKVVRKYFIFSCIFTLFLLLTGCAEKDNSKDSNKEAQNKSSEQTDNVHNDNNNRPDDNKVSNSKKSSKDIKIEEANIFQQDGILIKTKSFEKDGVYGPSIKVEIENLSDKNVTIQTAAVSVNDFMIDSIFSVNLAAGKKIVDEIILEKSDLELAKIKYIGKIDLTFHIINPQTYEIVRTLDAIQIKTNKADKINPATITQGTIVYDKNATKIYALQLSKDSVGDSIITFFIENNEEWPMIVQTLNFSVDGFMIDPVFSADVGANKKRVDKLSIFSSDLEKMNISDIKTVEFQLNIINANTWETKYTTDIIKLSFK